MSVDRNIKILDKKEFEERDNGCFFLPQNTINFIKNSFNEKYSTKQLDLFELKNVFNKYGIKFNKEDSFLKKLEDTEVHGNSKIDFDQFIDIISSKLSELYLEKDLVKFFSLFIGNGDSDKIEHEHLKKVDTNLKNDEIEEMIKSADIDKDNKINFEEFFKIVTKKI